MSLFFTPRRVRSQRWVAPDRSLSGEACGCGAVRECVRWRQREKIDARSKNQRDKWLFCVFEYVN